MKQLPPELAILPKEVTRLIGEEMFPDKVEELPSGFRRFFWNGNVLLDGWSKEINTWEELEANFKSGTVLIKDPDTGYAYNPRHVKRVEANKIIQGIIEMQHTIKMAKQSI